MFRLPQPLFAADAPPAGAAPSTPAGVVAPVAGAPATMPEGLPTQFWDQQTGQVNQGDLVKSYGELSAFKSQHDERIKTLPQKPEDYKLEIKLPDTVKLPDGLELKIDDKDPRVPAVRAFAHKNQLSQDAVNDLLAMHAQSEIAAHVAAEAEIQAEMTKLGENGKTRVAAIESFLKATVSKDEYEALRPVIGNATAVAAIEKLISKATTQSIPPHQNEAPPAAPKPRPADVFYGPKKAS